jgi:hypothetical protein
MGVGLQNRSNGVKKLKIHLKIGQICKIYKVDAKSLIKDLNKKIEK